MWAATLVSWPASCAFSRSLSGCVAASSAACSHAPIWRISASRSVVRAGLLIAVLLLVRIILGRVETKVRQLPNTGADLEGQIGVGDGELCKSLPEKVAVRFGRVRIEGRLSIEVVLGEPFHDHAHRLGV